MTNVFILILCCYVAIIPTQTDTSTSADVSKALNKIALAMSVQTEEQRKCKEEQRKRDEEHRKRDEKIISLLEDSKTDCKSMSKASNSFASDLLESLGISWTHAQSNETEGVDCEFSWAKGEDKETGNAVEYLKGLLQEVEVSVQGGATARVKILDVHTLFLDPIKCDHKEATGKTDALICLCKQIVDNRSRFSWALGIVEFKTDKDELNFSQQLLKLVSVSTYMSDFRQGTVLLGTDLNKKWEIMYFDRPNHVFHVILP